jgi:hypothetical protein
MSALAGLLLLAGLAGVPAVEAQDALPSTQDRPFTFEPAQIKSSESVLDLIAKDVRFDLMARPDAVTVRLPLASADWSLFKGVQPFVALSPSTVKPIEGAVGLATPDREVTDQPWKGLGMGAGVQWRLSDRLDLFGQYQFITLPGASASTGSSIMRRDSDNPGLRAGFSLHF